MVAKISKRRGSRPQERQRQAQEYEQKLLDVSRVARVTAGGRRFSFRAVIVIGDRKGKVGVGVKRGKDVQFAVEKAVRDAKKSLVRAPITDRGTIPHEVRGKSGSSIVFLKPAREGAGIRAGGAVRSVCDLAGYRNIVGKIISRSGNKLNISRATIKALNKIKISVSAKDEFSPEASDEASVPKEQNAPQEDVSGVQKDADTSTKTKETKKP